MWQARSRKGLFCPRLLIIMPAVQLVRLRSEISILNQSLNQPELFYRRLVDLLESYSNRVYRAGYSVAISHQVERFHVPPFVLNQLEVEVSQISRLDRNTTFALVDLLSLSSFWEVKYLASCILGHMDPNPPEDVLQRLKSWLTPELEPDLQEMVLSKAAQRVRVTHPYRWQEIIESWVESTDVAVKAMGLRGLQSLVRDPRYDNLPFVFRLVRDPIIQADQIFRPTMVQLMKALAERSPVETAFFVKQIVSTSPIPARSARLIRKMILDLPSENQVTLKELIKNLPGSDSGDEQEGY
jgi:hypothetical protein